MSTLPGVGRGKQAKILLLKDTPLISPKGLSFALKGVQYTAEGPNPNIVMPQKAIQLS